MVAGFILTSDPPGTTPDIARTHDSISIWKTFLNRNESADRALEDTKPHYH